MRYALLLRPSILLSVVAHGAVVAAAWSSRLPEAGTPPARIDAAFFEPGNPPPEETDAAVETEPAMALPEPVALWEPEPSEEPPPREEAPMAESAVAEAEFCAETPQGRIVAMELPRLELRVRRTSEAHASGPSGPSAPLRPAPAAPATAVSPSNRRPAVGAYRLPASPPPEYPAVARANGWQGIAVVRLSIEADGSVSRATLDRSSGWHSLDEAAVSATRAWQYAPRLEDGVAVASVLLQPVEFWLR